MGKSLIAAVLVACLVVSAAALTMKIDPKAEECFSEVLQVGDDVEVRWGVQDGGLLDIDVRVKFGGALLWNRLYFEGKEEGYYHLRPSAPGAYAFCFNNEMSRFTVKTVRFEFIRKNKPAPGGGDHAKPEDLSPMNQGLARIADLVTKLEVNNNYYSHRETVHRNTAESTNSRVTWWSVVETLFVLLLAAGQVYYLRTKVNRSNMGKRRV